MKFNDFLKIYADAPLIDSATFPLFSDRPEHLRRQVRDWVKKGYLAPVKRGIYLLGKQYRKTPISYPFIANYLVNPSCLSLECALGYYNLIPEKVTVITSITTKKTVTFSSEFGVFEYRSIKEELFFGFKKDIDQGLEFFICYPEKAILDFLYLNRIEPDYHAIESLRLQNMEKIDIERLYEFGSKYPLRVKKSIVILEDYILKYQKKYKALQ